jgi:lipoate-protein ligase A
VNNKKTLKKSIVAASVVAGVAGGLVAGLALGIPGFAGASSTSPKGAAVAFAESATLNVTAATDDSSPDTGNVETFSATPSADGSVTVGTHGERGGRGPKLDAVAEAIGITAEELRTELEAGKSIADIAKAKNVSVDVVIDALVADMKAHLAEEVASGEHTQEEADAKLAEFTTRVTEMVNTAGLPAPRGGMDGGKHGGRHGASLDTAATAIGITAEELRTELQAGKSIADVATAKGVSIDKVVEALVAEVKAHLDEEVASGEHTQEEADAKLAEAKTRITEMVNNPGLPAPKGHGGESGRGHGMKGGKGLDAAATAIGITADELRTELQAGKSIADVATAKGVSVDAVIAAMVADVKAHLDEEVASGEHTQEEADAKLAEATTRITEMVNRTAPTRGAMGEGEIRGLTGESGEHGPRGPRGQRGGHGPMGGGMGQAPAAQGEGASLNA